VQVQSLPRRDYLRTYQMRLDDFTAVRLTAAMGKSAFKKKEIGSGVAAGRRREEERIGARAPAQWPQRNLLQERPSTRHRHRRHHHGGGTRRTTLTNCSDRRPPRQRRAGKRRQGVARRFIGAMKMEAATRRRSERIFPAMKRCVRRGALYGCPSSMPSQNKQGRQAVRNIALATHRKGAGAYRQSSPANGRD